MNIEFKNFRCFSGVDFFPYLHELTFLFQILVKGSAVESFIRPKQQRWSSDAKGMEEEEEEEREEGREEGGGYQQQVIRMLGIPPERGKLCSS